MTNRDNFGRDLRGLREGGISFSIIRSFVRRAALAGFAALLPIISVRSALAQSTNLSVFQFAVFYNSLLEFTWCPTMNMNGRVHANGNIFVGSSRDLTFNSTVTATGGIYKTNSDNHPLSSMTGTVNYNDLPGYIANFPTLEVPIGTNNTLANSREIILMPPVGEDPNAALGSQRYYNKAGVVILVSNTTVTATFKNSPADISPLVVTATYSSTNYSGIVTNFPFLSVTNRFTDFREQSKTVKTTQIDVYYLTHWLPTNSWVTSKFPSGSGFYPNIFYVADSRTNVSTELVAVRLMNGFIIPTNPAPSGQPTGWTLATPNPLYVWDHYNIGPGGTAVAGNTDTSKTYPASLISDALTLLSSSWSDPGSFSLGSRYANNMTVNAAILTGNVITTASDWTDTNHFSGGVHNLPRLLESWTGSTLTLNTSLVNLYDSAKATNQYQNVNIYYQAPTRLFSFDTNFLNPTKLPPGAPFLAQAIAPVLAANLGSASLSANKQIQFAISGIPRFTYAVLASTNLLDWQPLTTNASPFTFVDTNTASFSRRYYRAIYLP